ILTVPSGTIGAPTGCNVGGEGYLGDHPFVDFHGPAACITGRWALNGSTLSDGGTSHGDFINWFDGAALNGDAVNFHGRFVYLDDNTKNVQNGQVIDRSNRQATSVLVNGINIPATVADEGGVTETFPDCPPPPPGTTFDCRSLTSAWSQVSVANGLSAGTPFSITILFYQGPNNLKGSKPVGYHTWVDTSNVIQSELINKTCVLTTAGVPTANSPIPCLVVSSGGKAVTIWTLHNGGFKF
ncbi:MAG: hypothetical protein QOJ75_1585, partial [Chloroflexota bacterium]|nr:hypothetical protein [Chloroflexota bacterium]